MTITLAAVYAPLGIQGGLTGSLFREFAFTLAGAVVVSGIVALTLSPMMGAKLLRSGDTERGFAGWINRRFESVRHGYSRSLTATLRYRPVVLTLWVIVALLTCRSTCSRSASWRPRGPGLLLRLRPGVRELRRSTRRSCSRIRCYDVYKSIPEHASIFQITLPNGGFGGMVTKPWSERTKTTQQIMMESMAPLSQIAGVRVIPQAPPPLPAAATSRSTW
jgi:multidrug efflux pump